MEKIRGYGRNPSSLHSLDMSISIQIHSSEQVRTQPQPTSTIVRYAHKASHPRFLPDNFAYSRQSVSEKHTIDLCAIIVVSINSFHHPPKSQ